MITIAPTPLSSHATPAPSPFAGRPLLDSLLHPNAVVLMTEIVMALLLVATIIVWALARWKPAWAGKELKSRVKSWWVMVALFILAIAIDWRLSIVFMAFMSFLALKEFFTISHLRIADRRAILLAYLAIPVQYWWVYDRWYGLFIIFIPVYMFLVIAARLVLTGETQRYMTSAAKIHWGLMAFVFGLSHMAFLLVLPPLQGFEPGGRGLLFYVIFLAEFNDVLQYIFGKSFGKRKLAPTVSPGKTWAGLLGGLVCTTALAVALRFLTPLTIGESLFAGFLIALLGPVGDLTMSAIKRDAGVKDFGNLIPGHGGVLDRVDSLCFSVPVFFHFVTWLYYPFPLVK